MAGAGPGQVHHALTFGVLAVAVGAYSMMQSLVAPALPEFERVLHTTASGASWIVTAYLIAASIATPIVGRLGDMWGKDRVLVGSLVALTAGMVVSALATDLVTMLIGRVLQGASGALFPLAFGIIRDEFPPERVAGAIASIAALLGTWGAVGIVLAGPIVDGLGHQYLFWLPLAPIVLALAGAIAWVPPSPVRCPGRVNWTGGALLAAWLATGLVALSRAPQWGWDDPRLLGLLLGSALLASAWIVNERRAPEPLVDLRMMRRRAVWTVNAAAFLVGAGMYSSAVLLPGFVQTPSSAGYGFGASVTQAGVFLLPSSVAMLLAGPIAGRMTRRVGSRAVLVAGCASLTLSFLIFAFAHGGAAQIYVGAALHGLGVGLAFASLANLMLEAVPPAQSGLATGMNTVLRRLGGAVGSTVGGALVTATVISGGRPTEDGYTTAFTVSAVVGVAALLLTLLVPRRDRAEAMASKGATT